jgi:hypothetical protein
MLSVGAAPLTEEAIKFHVMSDCSSEKVQRQRKEVVANLNALSQYLLAQLHTHTHTHRHTHTHTHTHTKQPDLICQVHLLP